MVTIVRRWFPPTAAAVAEARGFLRQELAARVDDETTADLVLAVSELATNAVKHAATPFEVAVETDGIVRVEVEDRSPQPLVPGGAGPTATSGRGLGIVEQVCDRWGVHITGDAKCVWCERDLSP